ncbi:GntR family transcriptional regulator [Dactylosporangium roseum]|uniref:GntR family transcriptional regulator n=1 Tax=Dactylosporangium roseum TaxID=47989 RepID=A0ABY5Z332_9ACTN|nr:GntR family transcriptional regulator [Dactylosporangium roseum]UWZ35163.1 GntR family transcriptional regulator [Dactylosporangium roseum]
MTVERVGQALYQRVADALREQIQQGAYQPGQFLPKESELVVRYAVSLMTLRRALAVLREEGLIVTRRGIPSFVRQQPHRRRVSLGAGCRLVSRMPSTPERLALGLDRGVPLVEIRQPDGTVERFGADRIEVVQPLK